MEVQPNSNKSYDRESEVWEEINQSLWEMITSEFPVDEGNQGVLPENSISSVELRKEACLSFARCAEIARSPEKIATDDTIHLNICHYCKMRISTFAKHQTAYSESSEELLPVVSQPSRVSELRQLLSDLFSRPLLAASGFATLILFFTVLAILVFRMLPESPNVARTSSANTEPEGTLSSDQVVDAPSSDAPGPTISATPRTPLTGAVESPDLAQSQTQEIPVRRSDEATSPLDLSGIPRAMHGFVIHVRNSAGINAPVLERFSLGLGQVRGGGVKPLSPVRKAIVETEPTFQWKARPNTVYEITLLDSDKNRIGGAKDLKENSWKSPTRLSPGRRYYWDLTATTGQETSTVKNVIFTVVDSAEMESVKSENKSHLDKASYFIYVGLLDEAVAELQAELRKNPDSRKARTILKQVKGWQRRLQ